MYKIGVIGDTESIMGYAALGLDIFTAENKQQTDEILSDSQLMDSYAIMYITETAAKDSMQFIDRYRSKRTPAIILIPDKNGSLGIGMADVKKAVEKAVGADILFQN